MKEPRKNTPELPESIPTTVKLEEFRQDLPALWNDCLNKVLKIERVLCR